MKSQSNQCLFCKFTEPVLIQLRVCLSEVYYGPLNTIKGMLSWSVNLLTLFLGRLSYCPFDISWKDVFCLAFYLKWKYFVLIDYILSETICLFGFCVLFSNMYPKIKFIAKSWSDLCIFYNIVIFWNFCLRKYFLFFFAEFELLMFHNNIVKISEKLNKQNLSKICLQVTYPTNFCIIFIHFYYGKKWKYWIF